jgi:hypothetical protein
MSSDFTFEELDISISSSSPAVMTINSYGSAVGPDDVTIMMRMLVTVKTTDSNNLCGRSDLAYDSEFRYIIYTPQLTLIDVQATPYEAEYRAQIGVELKIPCSPVWTTTPADLITIVTPTNFCLSVDGVAYVTDGVTVLASTWLTVTGTDIVILTNDVALVGTYNFELSWNWNDGFAYNQDFVFYFDV